MYTIRHENHFIYFVIHFIDANASLKNRVYATFTHSFLLFNYYN